MGKRAPADEAEYNPLGISLVRDVIESRDERLPDQATVRNSLHMGKTDLLSRHSEPRELQNFAKNREPLPASQEKLSFSPPIRVLIPVHEREELDELVVKLARELGTRVKLSHVLRSCLTLLRRSEEQLLKR